MTNWTATDITQFFKNAIGEAGNQVAEFMAVIVVIAIVIWVVKEVRTMF